MLILLYIILRVIYLPTFPLFVDGPLSSAAIKSTYEFRMLVRSSEKTNWEKRPLKRVCAVHASAVNSLTNYRLMLDLAASILLVAQYTEQAGFL